MSDVLPHIKWRVEVRPECMLPDGYGVAYVLWDRDVAIAYPIPLNLIVGGWRAFVRLMRVPPWLGHERRIRRIEREAYSRGFTDGEHQRMWDWMRQSVLR